MHGKKRLLFLTQWDESGASSRVRIYQFLPFFRDAGFEFEVRPLIKNDANRFFSAMASKGKILQFFITLFKMLLEQIRRVEDVFEADKFDAVIVQKDVLPFGLQFLLRWKQPEIIFEFDDPIWLKNPAYQNVPVIPELITLYRRHLLIRLLKISKLVIVDTPGLRDFSEQYCNNVLLLSSPIQVDKYKVKAPSNSPTKTLGWIGSPATTYLIERLLPALELLSKQVPITLLNVGSLPLASPSFTIENLNWSLENEQRALARFDVGLMPSDQDPFNCLRFGYKAVIYFSAGLPTLATDVGTNRFIIEDGVTGLLFHPTNPDDFVEKAFHILTNEGLRKEMGRRARQVAETQYDLPLLAARYLKAVNSLLDKKEAKNELRRNSVQR